MQNDITKFLMENLTGYTVKSQHRLTAMMAYQPEHNPQRRRPPTPRPDIAVLKEGELFGLLDAKYRDLWENPLPRDMLYQLAIYALGHQARRVATILYPTTYSLARDQVIEIREPMQGASRAQVILRPVHLPALAGAIGRQGIAGARMRNQMAGAMLGI